jgi:hypothetical protein
MQGNPAIQRVIAKWLEDQLKPELPSGRTLGILRPFPAKYNPRNDRFFQPDLRQHYFGAYVLFSPVPLRSGLWKALEIRNRQLTVA